MCFAFASCGKGGDDTSGNNGPVEIVVDPNYVRYDVGEALSTTTDGFGAQMDTDIYMPWNNMTAEDEALWEQRIADMNLQFTRIKFFPEFFEMANDNNDPNSFDRNAAGVDFNSVEMQALYKILDICEKYDINVDLSWYGCYTWFKSYDGKYQGTWMGYTSEDIGPNAWVSAPKKTDTFDGYSEYAENISVCLDYLINEKGYTCLYGFSVIAEMFMISNNVISWEAYAECCGVVDARLKKDGLRDKLYFLGTSNAAHNLTYFDDEQLLTKDYFDILGTGNYAWDINDPVESCENYYADIMEITHSLGKEGFYVAEFCQGKHFLNAVDKTDIDDYTAGVYIARFLIAAASNGATAFNHYILGDTFFTNAYVHTMGLWMYRDNNWKAHPEYYFWGLICKYTDIGSYVYPIKSQDYDLNLCAFRLPDGSWSYMIVNNGKITKKIAIVNEHDNRPASLSAYKITEASIPEDRACVLPSAYTTVDASSGVAYVNLPAQSFTVLSNKAA